jgi:hypothetical protein
LTNTRAVTRDLKNCDLKARNIAFVFIDFYIIETLYIPVTIPGPPREYLGPRAKGNLAPLLQFSK